ncbi:hypothetical protein B566_EDAN012846 [Ephemera danica]|nr:hypothetical protein B566_EDAN012846 [Ephemera danica]
MSTTMDTFKQEPTDKLDFLLDLPPPELCDDFHLIKLIVADLKLNGLFDQLRKVCLTNIEAKSSYANFRQRVETSVAQRLGVTKWTSDMDTNVLRQQLKKHLTLDLKMVDEEFDALVDEVFTADLINQTREAVLEKLKTIYKDYEVQESGTESSTGSTFPSATCNAEDHNKSQPEIVTVDNSMPMDLDGIPLPQTPPPPQEQCNNDTETVIKSEHLEENDCQFKMDGEKDKHGVETSRKQEFTYKHSKDRKSRSSDKKHEHRSDPHSSNKSKSLDKTLGIEQECKNTLSAECSVKISPSDDGSRHLTDKQSDPKDMGDKESTRTILSDSANKDQARKGVMNNPSESNHESESSQSSSSSDKSKHSKHTSKSEKYHSSKEKSKSHSSKTSHHSKSYSSKSYHHKSCHSHKSESKDSHRKIAIPKKCEELKEQKSSDESKEDKMRNKKSSDESKEDKMRNKKVSDKNLSEPEDELLYFEEIEVDVNLEFANTLVRKLEEDDTWSQISSVSVNSADLSDFDDGDIIVDVEESDWPKFSSMLNDGVQSALYPDDNQLQLQGKTTEPQVQGPIESAD